MTSISVASELLAYGNELEAQGAAQVGGSFSGDPSADELLESLPNAFLLAVLFTQGISAERAWAGPYLLKERLGTLELEFLAQNPALVRAAFQQQPMLHRFKETMPRWVCSAAQQLLDRYEGDASHIWEPGTHVITATERLAGFDGVGRKKSVMAVEILVRHFGAQLVGRECGQVAFDVQVRRMFLRSGLVSEDTREAVEAAASRACPEAPGTLDLPAWLIGRESCRPKAPLCEKCRLGKVCPRLVNRSVAGVGARTLLGAAKDESGE